MLWKSAIGHCHLYVAFGRWRTTFFVLISIVYLSKKKKRKKKSNLKPHYHMGTKALLHKTLRFRISKTQPLRLTIINSHTRKLNNSLYEYTHAQHKNNLFLSHEVQSTLRLPFLKNSFRFWLCKIQPLRPTIHTITEITVFSPITTLCFFLCIAH